MRVVWITGAAALALLAEPAAAQLLDAPLAIPEEPVIAFAGHQRYRANRRDYVRYRIEVTNRADYPAQLFAPAPHLAPCGRNRRAARAWIDIYNEDGTRLYGFCALRRPRDLRALWFAVPAGTEPPKRVYLELNDRETLIVYRSASLEIPAPPAAPVRPVRGAPVAP